MELCVLDASALLASMLDEPGAAKVDLRLDAACISAVNLSEVIAKLTDRGIPPDVIAETVAKFDLDVRPFDAVKPKKPGIFEDRHAILVCRLATAHVLHSPRISVHRS